MLGVVVDSVILFGVCLVIVSSVAPCSSWLLVGAGFVCTSAHEHSLVTYDSEKSWVHMKLCRTNELILVSRRRY